MSNSKIKIRSEEIAEFCKKNHIRKLSLFGSVLRDDFNSESDIDFLVEFQINTSFVCYLTNPDAMEKPTTISSKNKLDFHQSNCLIQINDKGDKIIDYSLNVVIQSDKKEWGDLKLVFNYVKEKICNKTIKFYSKTFFCTKSFFIYTFFQLLCDVSVFCY